MNSCAIFIFVLVFGGLSGCRDVGFHEIDVSAKKRASVQTARDVMAQIQQGLHNYYLVKHHYPSTTEAYLYDSIRNYILTEIDPIDLYRNDNGKGYFIAIGARSERIIYRYPPTIGLGDYTLYWVGPNGVDEEGEGDDVDAWQPSDTVHRYVRQREADLQNDHDPDRLRLISTGSNIYLDSVRLEVTRHDSMRYSNSWPISAYFKDRPELTDDERKQIVRSELDRFLTPGAFVHTDSLLVQGLDHWLVLKPKSPELTEIIQSGEIMFNYYAGDRGSQGIAWLKSKKKFVVVWKN
ncbi:MAG TPA: hypothetical protein VFD13_06175 [Candidatus Kapabacteria bacterium]|nr:hypothetical protein [Candidatus Kapabacteria bacterium]